nr:LOW QUALITY PROTEIN: uncharacterized protein LOC110004536 [Labrus bergylta]
MDVTVAVNDTAGSQGAPNCSELLSWLNTTLKADFTKVEQVCTGTAFCQLMVWCFPQSLQLSKVRFQSYNNADCLINFSILRDAFRKVGVRRYIPIKTLVERNSLVCLAFLHWFKQFFEENRTDQEYDPIKARGGLRLLPADSGGSGHCQASRTPLQTSGVNVKKSQDAKTAEVQSKEKSKEGLNKNDDVIVLISDEDDVLGVTTELEAEKMETTVNGDCAQPQDVNSGAAAVVDGNQGTSFPCRDTLLCFIRRYCEDSNIKAKTHRAMLSATHPSDIIQACCHTPYCLYLYMGVELGEGHTTSVVLIGYFDQNLEVSVVRPLFTLQMSVDTPANTDTEPVPGKETGEMSVDPPAMTETVTGKETGNTDARLLLDSLEKSGLPIYYLTMFYCNTPNPKLSQVFVSKLQTINSKFLSLCGLSGMVERACEAALLASFSPAVDLVKVIHHHHSTCPSNQTLKLIFAGAYNPSLNTSEQFMFIINSVKRMVEKWRALVDYFKSAGQSEDARRIRNQLMDHKVKLHFLFISSALQPLRALHNMRQQDKEDVATQLQFAAMIVSTYTSSLLEPSARQDFLRGRDLQLLNDEKKQLPPSKLDVGPQAREFLWATAVVDLGEQERKEFLRNAATFYKVTLESLVESLPKQLGDMALRNISIMLKHPDDPKALSELGLHLGLCEPGSQEHELLIKDYVRVIDMVEDKRTSGPGKDQSWRKTGLTLLALPGSLQPEAVFAKVVVNRAPREPGRSAGRPRVRRRRYSHTGNDDRKKKEKGDGESSSEEGESSQTKPVLEIPVKHHAEDSGHTDNSSDVVVVEDFEKWPTKRGAESEEEVDVRGESEIRPNTPAEEESQRTPVAETVYIVSEEDDDNVVSKINSSDPAKYVGILVWGLVNGFSTWPAIIVASEEIQPPGKRMVWWYGQSMSTQVSVKDLKPFGAFAKHFCSNSFAVFITYREAIFMSLQEAALRCKKRFSVDVADKDEQLKHMMDWAFGGFLPAGPDGFKPAGATNGETKKMNHKPKVKKKLFLKASASDNSVKSSSSSMSSKSGNTPELKKDKNKSSSSAHKRAGGGSKTAGEEELDSAGQDAKGVLKKKKKSRGELSAQRGGWGRGGKVQQKKISLLDGLDTDMSPDFVPSKKRTLTKTCNKVDRTTSVYTQPDQKFRESTIREIMKLNQDIEGFCLCCTTKDVEISHPLFQGSLCSKCKNNLTETLHRYDEDGYQSYCTICCYGLEVILCGNNSCSRSYCTDCLNILVGPGTFDELKEKDPWICYLCLPRKPHGALIPREDWSIRVQELFANNSAMAFEPHRVYPSIPADCRRPIRVLSLFDGIATGYFVLQELGFQVEKYVASEICEDSLAVAEVNHDRKIVQVGDARFISEKHLEKWGPFDLLIGGSPCNDLSIVNPYRKGLYEGTGRLFFEFYRILQLLKPKEEDPRPFFWLFENVVFMNTHDKVNICRFLESNPVLVDAVNVSPAHRSRCFWGNIPGMSRPIIASQSDKLTLQDCLEIGREARVTKVRTITTNRNSLKQGKDVSLLPVLYNGREDNLWITELEKIFGFPKHYTDVRDMNRLQRQKVLGKAWSVPVIRHLFAPLKDYFSCKELPPITTSSLPPSPSPSPSSPASPELQQLR